MYFISNDLMRFNMPIMVSRKGRALFQNWLVLYKNKSISHAQFVLLFNFHSWWSKMGESSFNAILHFVWCVPVLAYLLAIVKSYIIITSPTSFLQFLTFFYTHKTCQELLDVHRIELLQSFSSALFLDSQWYMIRKPSKFMRDAPPSVLLVRKNVELFKRQSGYSEYWPRFN